MAALAIIGIVYGALVALVPAEHEETGGVLFRVSHLGFVVLGIFSFTQQGLDGAVYQMLNHGVSTGALFMLVGYLYERRHSLEISAYGGVATPAPNLAIVALITTLASIGLPMLNNFVGEYLVLQGASQTNFTWVVFAALGVILSACYMLWLYQRTFYGRASESLAHHMYDLTMREWAAILPLLVLMFWMGIFSQSFMPSISAQNAEQILRSRPGRKVSGSAAVADDPERLVAARTGASSSLLTTLATDTAAEHPGIPVKSPSPPLRHSSCRGVPSLVEVSNAR